jgi:hypothetical protein
MADAARAIRLIARDRDKSHDPSQGEVIEGLGDPVGLGKRRLLVAEICLPGGFNL